jgi:hypothetical protein
MRTWKEIIKEATAAEIRRAGEAALRDEKMKNRKISAVEKAKKRQEYIDLAKQREDRKAAYFDWVKGNAEQNKKDRIEKLRQTGVQKNVDKAKASISGIKTQQISDKEGDATAYSKAIGNVGSAAAGVGGAIVYGVKAGLAKRKADAARKAEAQTPDKPNIPEKKPRTGGILGGRPPAPKPATPGTGAPKPTGPVRPSIGNVTGPASNPKRPNPPAKPTGPVRPSIGNVTGPASNPKRPRGMRTEEYSNWREEFLYEVETEKTNTKGKKKDIVDVMKGKNKIDLNPNEGQVKESIDLTDTSQKQQIQQQQVQTRNQTMFQKKQQSLQQKFQQISNQKLSLTKQGKLALPGTHTEAYDDETFRQHSRETFVTHKPSSTRAKTLKVLEKMKELNKDVKVKKKKKIKLKEEGPVLSVGRGEKLSVERGGGLTQKGRDKYNRATGSNLQAPVTGDVKPGSKAAQRRKNFCSRSRSWKGERGLAARRRWKC